MPKPYIHLTFSKTPFITNLCCCFSRISNVVEVSPRSPLFSSYSVQFNGIGSPGLNVALEPGLVFHFPAERPPYCFAPQTPTTVCPNFAADFPSRSIASVADRRPGKQNITTTTTTSSTTKSHFSVTGADLVSLSSSSSSSSMIRSSLFQRRSISCMLGSRQRGLPDRDHHSQKRSSMVTVTDTRAVAFNKITPSETWTAATLRSQRPTRSNVGHAVPPSCETLGRTNIAQSSQTVHSVIC